MRDRPARSTVRRARFQTEALPGDEVVVAANFAHETRGVKCIGFRAPGSRRLRRDTDWAGYSDGSGGVREP